MEKLKTPARRGEGFVCLHGGADNEAHITGAIRSQVLTHRHGIPRQLVGLIGALHYGEARNG